MFKTIPGYTDYEINEVGEVKRPAHTDSLNRSRADRYMTIGYSSGTCVGYRQTSIWSDEPRKQVNCLIHRLVALTFIPNPEGKRTVNHIDGDKHNNSVDNLEWLSDKENINHAQELGLRSSR